MYVERLEDSYRWSLIHRGGPYPLLRITAKYLQVDYNSIIVGCREVGDGWSGLGGNESEPLEPDAWAVLSFRDQLSQPMPTVSSARSSIADLGMTAASI